MVTINRFKNLPNQVASTNRFKGLTEEPIAVSNTSSTPALPKTYSQVVMENGKPVMKQVTTGSGTISAPVEKPYGTGGILGPDFQKDVIQKTYKDVGKLAKDIVVTYPLRAATSLFSSIGNNKPITPETPTEKFFFGEEPIKSIQQQTAEGSKWLQEKTGISSNVATPLAFVGVGTMTGLDLTPIGGAKSKLTKEIVNAKTIEEGLAIAKKLGIADNLANDFAKEVVAIDNSAKANKLIETVKNNSSVKNVTPIVDKAKVTPEGDSLQQTILKSRAEQDAITKSNLNAPLPEEFPVQAKEIRNIVAKSDIPNNLQYYKDINASEKQFRDVYRNVEDVFGKDAPVIKKTVLDPFDEGKGAYIKMLEDEKRAVMENVPFAKSSVESKFIQKYGEGRVTMAELIEKFGTKKASQIAKADEFFRTKYDELLSKLNKIEQQIYPNTPYKWTPKRASYYRHFHEVSNDFSRLQNILENPIRIDPLLVGKSEETLPKSKWASFKQRRFGTDTKEDAIGGYLDYLKSASYAINIDPHIGKFRELADTLRRGSGKEKNVNNFIYFLDKFANGLAGKTTEPDRFLMEHIPGGRTTLSALNWLNSRVKANTILGSASAALAQFYNLPIGIASAGKINSAKAIIKTLGQIFVENKPMSKSVFLKERYFKGFAEFDKGMLNNAKKFAQWMITAGDEITTKFIWNGQYEKAIQEGAENAVKYADDATRKLVGGRGIGEKSLLQNSQAFQMVAPFQLEITNLWWTMEELAKNNKGIMKKFDKFATLFLSLYLLNNGVEKLTGQRPVLDPIKAVADGIDTLEREPNAKGATMATGRLFGEALSNLPLGQNVAELYPEYGKTIAGVKLPTRKELFGRTDPTRFGGGLLAFKGLSDPLFKVLPPFGGGQLKKTIQGVSTVAQGKALSDSGKFQYPVADTPANYATGAIFGKYSLPESQKYYNKKSPVKSPTSGTTNRFKGL